MNKTIGLRFLMTGPSFLNILILEEKAKELIKQFHMQTLPARIGDADNRLPGSCHWGVLSSTITAIHTFDPSDMVTPTGLPTRTNTMPLPVKGS